MKPPAKKAAPAKRVKKPPPAPPPTPLPTDPAYKFYVSLFRQNPRSDMAIRWLCKNGLGHIVIDVASLIVTKKKTI